MSDHAALNEALKSFGSAKAETPPGNEDEGDALLSAAALRSLSGDSTLFKVLSDYAKSEGWIFGIPCNDDLPFHGLMPEQIAEIKRRLGADEPIAAEDEVKATFDLLSALHPVP
jgi:hypothetical protein